MLGHPVAHSLSPAIHRTFYQRHGIDATFELVDVAPAELGTWSRELAFSRYDGLSVTYPFKEELFRAVAERDETASDLRAVNCLVPLEGGGFNLFGAMTRPPGVLEPSSLPYRGHNTDGEGFCLFLERELAFKLRDKRVLVLGAGASAKSVVRAIHGRSPARLTVLNRTAARLEEPFFRRLAGIDLKPFSGVESWPALLAATDLVVHATPLGLAGAKVSDPLPEGIWNIAPATLVIDLNYRSGERTPFLAELLKASRCDPARVHDGKGMLLHQAAEAFRLWFGQLPDTSGMLAQLGA